MRITIFTLLTVLILNSAGVAYSQTGSINLTIYNIKEAKGVIHVLLWNSVDGFPKDKDKCCKKDSIEITSDSATIEWNGISPGEYAISLFQDVNNNRYFDRSRITRTFEPFGLSGAPDFSDRPVKFKDCSFKVDDKNIIIKISLIYKEDLEKYR